MSAERPSEVETIHAVLGVHFVMWHNLDDGPPGEWRCQCGLKFGFSDSAIAHQADEISSVLADHDARVRAEALREAAGALRQMALLRFDQFGPLDARGAAIWDAGCYISPDEADR